MFQIPYHFFRPEPKQSKPANVFPFGYSPPLSDGDLAVYNSEQLSPFERIKYCAQWFDRPIDDFRNWQIIVSTKEYGEFLFTNPKYVTRDTTKTSARTVMHWELDVLANCTFTGFRVFDPDNRFLAKSNNHLDYWDMYVGDSLNVSYTLSA